MVLTISTNIIQQLKQCTVKRAIVQPDLPKKTAELTEGMNHWQRVEQSEFIQLGTTNHRESDID